MPGDTDATDYDCAVDGTILEQFAGIGNWAKVREVSTNDGPGNRAYGHNKQRLANKVNFDLKVRSTSRSVQFLDGLVDSQKSVPIKAIIVRHLDEYESGQEIGIGCERGVLTGPTKMAGEGDSTDYSYSVSGIGPISEFKS
jgi:hypothetical protein